jgi:hypothetical protein
LEIGDQGMKEEENKTKFVRPHEALCQKINPIRKEIKK